MKGFHTVAEFAEIVGLTRVRVYQLVKELNLPHERAGPTILLASKGIQTVRNRNTKAGPKGPRKPPTPGVSP